MSATIPVRIRELLTQQRLDGEAFASAWEAAVATVRGRQADEWLTALQSTREAWARAYAGEPLRRPEQALSLVLEDREPLTPTRCQTCRGPLPPTPRGRRKFCSEQCRRASYK
jgi:hypothetical protein